MNRSGNRLGLGLVIGGAVAVAIAAFLPLYEAAGTFSSVAQNTFIQHGGWLLIGGAIAIAVSGVRVSQRKPNGWLWTAILCVINAVFLVVWAKHEENRTLYPIGADGVPDSSQPGTVADFGIAIYVAGAVLAVAFIGSLMFVRSTREASRMMILWLGPGRKCQEPRSVRIARNPSSPTPGCASTVATVLPPK
jgi:hypothetical protein